jgi:hypothetical protein
MLLVVHCLVYGLVLWWRSLGFGFALIGPCGLGVGGT